MRVQQSKIQKGKTAAHTLQAILIFVAGCITLAIFTKDGTTDGRTKYFFALVSVALSCSRTSLLTMPCSASSPCLRCYT